MPTTQPDKPTAPDWLDTDAWPFTPRSVMIDGHWMAYTDEGAGPVLLFVHAGMWSFVFRDVIVRLQESFRCVTLDFPGSGASPQPFDGRPPDLVASSRMLETFVDALDIDRLTLVCHDLGGAVGFGLAARRPGLIDGMVFANTFAWRPDRKLLRAMLRITGGRTLTAIDVATNLIPRLTATRFGVGRHLDRADRKLFLEPFRSRTARRRFHDLLGDALTIDDHFDRIDRAMRTTLRDKPTLTIYGERNDPFGFQARVEATLGDVESIVMPNGNHFPMMDDPDLFAESVKSWHAREVAIGIAAR